MSNRAKIGCWVGLDSAGIVQAGHGVYADTDEIEAKSFVSAGRLRAVRVGPEVVVRIGEPLDGPELVLVKTFPGSLEWVER